MLNQYGRSWFHIQLVFPPRTVPQQRDDFNCPVAILLVLCDLIPWRRTARMLASFAVWASSFCSSASARAACKERPQDVADGLIHRQTTKIQRYKHVHYYCSLQTRSTVQHNQTIKKRNTSSSDTSWRIQ